MNPTLTQAITAARAGDLIAAADLLRGIVASEPANKDAWLWLGGVTTNTLERRYALERVLTLDPGNARARMGLERLWADQQAAGLVANAPPAVRSTLEEDQGVSPAAAPPSAAFDQQSVVRQEQGVGPVAVPPSAAFDQGSVVRQDQGISPVAAPPPVAFDQGSVAISGSGDALTPSTPLPQDDPYHSATIPVRTITAAAPPPAVAQTFTPPPTAADAPFAAFQTPVAAPQPLPFHDAPTLAHPVVVSAPPRQRIEPLPPLPPPPTTDRLTVPPPAAIRRASPLAIVARIILVLLWLAVTAFVGVGAYLAWTSAQQLQADPATPIPDILVALSDAGGWSSVGETFLTVAYVSGGIALFALLITLGLTLRWRVAWLLHLFFAVLLAGIGVILAVVAWTFGGEFTGLGGMVGINDSRWGSVLVALLLAWPLLLAFIAWNEFWGRKRNPSPSSIT